MWLIMFFIGVVVILTITIGVVAWHFYRYPTPSSTPLYSLEEYQDGAFIHRMTGTNTVPSPTERVYLNRPTEYCASPQEMIHTRDQPVVWVRLGSPNVLQKLGLPWPRPADVDTFVHHILPQRTTPFVLVTTDGDRSVPEELRQKSVQTLLDHPLLRAWYTQNLTLSHPRLHPIPIGLCLHVRQKDQTCAEVMQTFQRIRGAQIPIEERRLRIWSDCHLASYPLRHRNPRRHWHDIIDEIQYVDRPESRLPRLDIWQNYSEYSFVVSLPGNGLDCHRTWEALYMGAIVITEPTALQSTLYDTYRVVELPRSEWTTRLNDAQWLLDTRDRLGKRPVYQKTPTEWRNSLHELAK